MRRVPEDVGTHMDEVDLEGLQEFSLGGDSTEVSCPKKQFSRRRGSERFVLSSTWVQTALRIARSDATEEQSHTDVGSRLIRRGTLKLHAECLEGDESWAWRG